MTERKSSKRPKTSLQKPVVSTPLRESDGAIRIERLIELLQEFLAIERGGVSLYSLTLQRSDNADIREKVRKLQAQTEHHAGLLENAIRKLGGNPELPSWNADIQSERVRYMLGLEAPDNLRQIVDIENLMLTETKCHLDWQLLKEIIPYLDEPETKTVIESMVEEVLSEEDDHVDWATQALTRMVLEALVERRDQSLAA